jgi:hypothetical protein
VSLLAVPCARLACVAGGDRGTTIAKWVSVAVVSGLLGTALLTLPPKKE